MEGHIYHWKHGWIPLTHYAALVKAHGSHKGAAKYLSGSNGHHGTESHKLAAATQTTAHLQIRQGVHGGESGHHIVGKDAHGRSVKVFTPGDRSEAEKVVGNIKAGRPAFDTTPGAGKDARTMTGAEKIKAAEIMHGTGSRQHVAAMTRFGGHDASTPRWQRLANGNRVSETSDGVTVTDGERTVHILGTSVAALREARRLAARDLRNLFAVSRKKKGSGNHAGEGVIKLNADGSYTGPKAWAL